MFISLRTLCFKGKTKIVYEIEIFVIDFQFLLEPAIDIHNMYIRIFSHAQDNYCNRKCFFPFLAGAIYLFGKYIFQYKHPKHHTYIHNCMPG